MPDGRFLNKSVSVSDKLSSEAMPLDAALAFTWALAHLDVEGRITGNPRTFKNLVLPNRYDITPARVAEILTILATSKLVEWYEAGGVMVLQFPGFLANQPRIRPEREAKSKLPPLDENARLIVPVEIPSNHSGPTPDQLRTNPGVLRTNSAQTILHQSKLKDTDANASGKPKSESFPQIHNAAATLEAAPADPQPDLAEAFEAESFPTGEMMQELAAGVLAHQNGAPERVRLPHKNGAKTSADSSDMNEADLTDGQLMALVRSHFYAPDGKPPTGYDEGREFGCFAWLREHGATGRSIAEHIEGAAAIRDSGGIVAPGIEPVNWLPKDAKLTMRALVKAGSGVQQLWQLAEIRRAADLKASGKGKSKLAGGRIQIKVDQ